MKNGLLRYQGGKVRVARDLLSLAPESYSSYAEPFCGGAGVFWSVDPELPRWLNDVDPHIAKLYQWFRDDPDSVATIRAMVAELVNDASLIKRRFHLAKLDYALDPSPLAFLLLNRFAYGQFVKEQRSNYCSFSWHHLRNGIQCLTQEHLEHCRSLLQGTKITNWDFADVLSELDDDCFAMIDPPYFQSGWYNREIDLKRHRELRDILRDAPFKFLMTIAHSEFFHDLYCSGDFHVLRRQYKYTGILRTKARSKTELIVRNYE